MDKDEAFSALTELAARVKRLEDMDEIRQLYIDYGRHLDAGDPVAYAALFARDAKLRLGPVMRGDSRADIERAATKLRQSAGNGPKNSIHLLASPRVEITGDMATGECVWAAISRSESGPPKVLVGHHSDELVREDGRWRFARRLGFVDIGALS